MKDAFGLFLAIYVPVAVFPILIYTVYVCEWVNRYYSIDENNSSQNIKYEISVGKILGFVFMCVLFPPIPVILFIIWIIEKLNKHIFSKKIKISRKKRPVVNSLINKLN